MRVALVLAVSFLLSAGCSETGQPSAQGPDLAPPVQAPEPALDDTVVVLAETYAYAVDQDLPPTTMEVPVGGASLHVSLILRGSPCGAAADVTEPGQAAVVFTPPSGGIQVMRFGGAIGCDPGGIATESTMRGILPYEAGTWHVGFAGRGAGASLDLLVVAEPPAAG